VKALDDWAPGVKRHVFSNRRKLYYELIRARSVLNELYSGCHFVWGLDLSLTGTGFAAIDVEAGDMIVDKCSTAKGLALHDRNILIADWLQNRYQILKPKIIIMEAAFIPFGKNMRITHAIRLNKLNHVIECLLYCMGGAIYRNVMPRSIKKYTIGDPSADKRKIQEYLTEKYGMTIDDNDMSDALSMALMGYDLFKLLTEFQFQDFDINSKKSMLSFFHALGDFFDNKKRAEVWFGLLTTGDSLVTICPEIKKTVVVRRHPVALTYSARSKKRIIKLLRHTQ